MKFCSICSNMYIIHIDTQNSKQLVYHCKKCGQEEIITNSEEFRISVTNSETKNTISSFINQYTIYDNTLPRINNIDCPNEKCKTNVDNTEKEILNIRYDDTDMKYVNLCSTCGTVWEIKPN